jgi:PemK-like, MazF-like toxin of type II toxin-antitoxin system
MMVFERGDIILVPFPFTDQTTIKKRPAVVISSNEYNKILSDVIIMAVTSQTERSFNVGECIIKDWQYAGLLKPSSIKPVISTIEQNLILKKLGSLSSEDRITLNEGIKELLDLK